MLAIDIEFSRIRARDMMVVGSVIGHPFITCCVPLPPQPDNVGVDDAVIPCVYDGCFRFILNCSLNKLNCRQLTPYALKRGSRAVGNI